jgi:hypothetical protein
MSLQGVTFWGPLLNAQVAPTSGHSCLMQGNSCDIRHTRALRNSFVIGSYSLFGIGIARAFPSCSEAAAIAAETDSAANQFGAHDRARTTPARHISVLVACGCPSNTCRISV